MLSLPEKMFCMMCRVVLLLYISKAPDSISFSFINYAAHCQAWLSYGKDCGRGNERLDAKALAVDHVAEGEEGGSKIP